MPLRICALSKVITYKLTDTIIIEFFLGTSRIEVNITNTSTL